MNLLSTESFEDTFGKKATRKRPRLLTAQDSETLIKVAMEKSGAVDQARCVMGSECLHSACILWRS